MRKQYAYQTRIGTFYIVSTDDGRFHPYYDGETLGAYSSPQHAIDDLAGGHTFSIAGGVDTSTLGIPCDLGEWERYAVNSN